MHKYIAFFKIGYQVTSTYPAPIFFRVLRHAAIVGLLVVLWAALLTDKNNLYGFSFRSIVTYYLLVEIIDILYTQTPARLLNRDIQTGDLSNFLTKPFDYWGYMFSYTLGQQLAASTLSLVVVICLFLFFPAVITTPPNAFYIFAFFISCCIAYFLSHQLFFVMGTLSFWVTESAHIRQGFNQFIGLVGGKWIPLSIFPIAFTGLVSLLPFKYLFNFPVRVFQGQIPSDQIFRAIITEAVWLGLFLWLGKIFWKLGLKGYEAYGH